MRETLPDADRAASGGPDRFPVLTSDISATTPSAAVDLILSWVRQRDRRYVNVCTSDTTVQAYRDPSLASIINRAGMATPDGMPLVWLGRLQKRRVARVYGPDLMLGVCERGQEQGLRHFFYGCTEPTLQALATRLAQRFPKLSIAGVHAPPFRALSREEEGNVAGLINAAAPDIVWVGLGTPKQDFWVAHFRTMLEAPVLIAVGAAFDFHAGVVRQAPRWMMRCGLEWLYRLCREPRRLWRRYLIGNAVFLALILRQWLRALPRPLQRGMRAE